MIGECCWVNTLTLLLVETLICIFADFTITNEALIRMVICVNK